MNQDSVFTKIIKGELPSNKVYEDEHTIAIIPLKTVGLAHVIVIPKLQIDKFYELPDPEYQALMSTVKKVANRIDQVIGAKRVGLKVEGTEVPHAHVHVIAFNTVDEFHKIADESTPIDPETQKAMAKKLAF